MKTTNSKALPPCMLLRGARYTHDLVLNRGKPTEKPNTNASAGTQYPVITPAEILTMVQNPPSVDKLDGASMIPSAYHEHDGRRFDVQKAKGVFWWLPMDVDSGNPTKAALTAAVRRVLGAGVGFWVYSTKSATQKKRKWRVLVQLATPVAGADYGRTQKALIALMKEAGVALDPVMSRTGQIVILPNRGAHYDYHIETGGPLSLGDAHQIIKRKVELDEAAAVDEAASEAKWAKREADRKARISSGETTAVEHFNANHTIADLFDKYGYGPAGDYDWTSPNSDSGSPSTQDRGNHWVTLGNGDLSKGVGRVSEAGNATGDAFDLYVHWEHGGQFNAAVTAYHTAAGLGSPNAKAQFEPVIMPGSDEEHDEMADLFGDEVADMALATRDAVQRFGVGAAPAQRGAVVTKNGKITWCLSTAVAVLESHQDCRDTLAFNEMTSTTMVISPLPGQSPAGFKPHDLNDVDLGFLEIFFNKQGFPRVAEKTLLAAITMVADASTINPVRFYLEGLKWDGTQRIEGWLSRYLGAVDDVYTREVGKRTLIGAVARALRPGCKLDTVLILEGRQGVGKSRALGVLAGDEYFGDGLPDLRNKDAQEYLQGMWMVEMAELHVVTRGEMEVTKAFLSRRKDRFRASYGRGVKEYPRRCVMIGTTNSDNYLRDETGNRRFWPVKVKAASIPELTRDRDQLWAEAVALFRAGERWWLDAPGERLAVIEQEQRGEDDIWIAPILAHVAGKTEISIREIVKDVLHVLDKDATRATSNRVAGILRRAHWERDGLITSGEHRNQAKYVPRRGA